MKLLPALLMLAPLCFWGQIQPDRPGETDAAYTQAPGALLWESGYRFEKENKLHVGENELRYGIAKHLELRLTSLADFNGKSSEYLVGMKYRFIEQEGMRPGLGIMANTNFKTYLIKLLYNQSLTENLDLEAYAGFEKAADGDMYKIAANVGWSLNDRWSVFGEYYSDFSSSSPAHSADAGILFLINDHIQADFSFGGPFKDFPNQYFLTAGISAQLIAPKK